MLNRNYQFLLLFFLLPLLTLAQSTFTHEDSLRGSNTPERAWWDVLHYDISIQPNIPNKRISGSNTITFNAISSGQAMQIDLQLPMQIDSVVMNKKHIPITRNLNVYHLNLSGQSIQAGNTYSLTIGFSGKPHEAKRPPWDGGWIWAKDSLGNPWISVACEGIGASVWLPCKDYWSDEPDQGASLSIIVPDTLTAVGNGRLEEEKNISNKLKLFKWVVTNPINNYNIIPYIGEYAHWHEEYKGEKGKLDCDFWVLTYDKAKAKKHFTQAFDMLKCFEHWFGPYPFYEDSYKLVQAPHLGMEHQSAVAYGNKFQNGYMGRDLSGTGQGLKWDFIIVHESGHEWFGNNITAKDPADMWIHEGFTSYSEVIYTTCMFGTEAGNEYAQGTRQRIKNDSPVIGQYGVNKEGGGDMYPKGVALIHNIRQLMNDDEKFRMMLRSLNETFRHKTVTTQEVENHINIFSGINFSKVFDQYLRTTQVPILEYKIVKQKLNYCWTNCIQGFNMKLKLSDGTWISPTTEWKKMKWKNKKAFSTDPNFYILTKKVGK